MAIQKNIKINVDTGQAVKDVDKLDDSFKNLDTQTEKTSAGLKDVGENGGAIAILDSLTGGLATRVRDAYEATKLFNFSLKGTRTALIATGVGAFVVALGVIVAYWDDIVDFVNQVNKKLEEQNLLIQKQIELIDLDLELNKLLEESLKLQGKSTDDILKKRDELLQAKQLELLAEQQLVLNQREILSGRALELNWLQRLIKAERERVGVSYTPPKISEEDQEALDAFDKRIKEINLALVALANQRALLGKEEPKETEGKSNKKREKAFTLDNGLKPDDAITLDSKKLLAEKTAEINDKVTQDILTSEAAILNAKRLTRDLEIQYRQQVKDASLQLASSTLNALGALAEEGSALSKGVAVAQAIMSTYQGVNAALAQTTDPTPTQSLRFANAAAVGIAGLLNVKKILETKPISKSSGNISGGRGAAPAAPSFNLVEGTQENQIANSLNNREPVQSFVVATAVTSSQELNRNAESNGSL